MLYAVRQQIYLALDYTKSVEQINRAPLVKSRIRKIDEAILQKERFWLRLRDINRRFIRIGRMILSVRVTIFICVKTMRGKKLH